MDRKSTAMQKSGLLLLTAFLTLTSALTLAATKLPVSKTTDQDILEQKKEAQKDAVEIEGDLMPASVQAAIDNLPEDTTPRYDISNIALSGNTLFSNEQLLSDIPAVYNASKDGSVESAFLYDLRPLQQVVAAAGISQSVSARTIQGFTQYVLSIYQKKNYAGIYVYVPAEAFEAGKELEQGILPIRVLEAPVTKISSSYSDVQNQPVEQGYLSQSLLEGWSPIEEGEVANRKALDDYLNLLNLNPDRYVGAMVSKGDEPETLAVTYNVYEAKPDHYFVQLDNSGTKDIQWKPRFGYINTNLLGFDDKLTAIYQVPVDSQWDEEYALYGAYDFPILGPRLRLNLYAGYNEFDIADAGINFLGRGQFYGGTLRYNMFQKNDWFFDATGSLRYEESKVTPSLAFFASNLHILTWGYGFQIYRSNDMSDTSFGFDQVISLDGSHEANFDFARYDYIDGSDGDFNIYTTTARHSQYLDTNKIQRVSGSFKWVTSDERLAPVKMTSFGGMYTVRGYDEYEITADGGILASVQYEYDVIRKSMTELFGEEATEEDRKPFLRKLAPLLFVDYGLAKTEDAIKPAEDDDIELCSWGGGLITELGENFSGTVYYGYPLIATDNTHTGKGRVHVGLLFRW